MRYTPDNITELGPNEIFVFGSDREGCHEQGAAKTACERFGAAKSKGAGLYGQSYAIPTCGETLADIWRSVDEFLDFAGMMDQTMFYVTRIGCGMSGFADEQIAPMFDRAIDGYNIILPESFVRIIARRRMDEGRNLPFGFTLD